MQNRMPRSLFIICLLSALSFINCTDDDDDLLVHCDECEQVEDTGSESDATPDASVDTSDVSDISDVGSGDEGISLPETDTSISLSARVEVDGQGSGHIGAVDIVDSVGTVTIDDQVVEALVYLKIPWEEFDRTLYQTIAVSAEALHVLWFYCDDEDELREIWFESTAGLDLQWEQGSGSCSGLDQAHSPQVNFPAIHWPLPETLDHYEVTGTGIDIGPDTSNTVALAGVDHEVLVFDEVDCLTTCGGAGWYELHALLWDRETPRVYFGIFYLYGDDSDVQLAWMIGLPELDDPGTLYFDAQWERSGG